MASPSQQRRGNGGDGSGDDDSMVLSMLSTSAAGEKRAADAAAATGDAAEVEPVPPPPAAKRARTKKKRNEDDPHLKHMAPVSTYSPSILLQKLLRYIADAHGGSRFAPLQERVSTAKEAPHWPHLNDEDEVVNFSWTKNAHISRGMYPPSYCFPLSEHSYLGI